MSNYVTVDGNQAAAHVAYDFTEVAAIYPITPSSPMAEHTDRWSAQGRLNMFGQRVQLTEMQSEAGAIAAIHGVLQAGGLGTSFTSSQGLMLMVPVLYRIAGERLPGVLHVASRTVGTHAMSIFGDHSDVMACRDTGFAQLSSGSVQEAADMAAVAHLAAVKGSIPFMHFFDGFRTSHELSRIDMPDTKELTALMDTEALDRFRARALNPEHPMLRATVQNGDTYFQQREANNTAYDQLADVVEGVMAQVAGVTGREHHVFDYYGAADATDVVVAMGSVSGTAQEACDYLNAHAQADGTGKRYGYLQVHLYRPFSAKHFLGALPETVERIAVLDRCKCMGSAGEPLYLDVSNVIANSSRAGKVTVIGGRYGLASKDTDTAQIVAVFDNLAAPEPTRSFTIGIDDDVTHLSLPVRPLEDFEDGDTYSCKFWGLGGDGTVGANHNTIRILGDCADMFAQAYFEYDSKKSFGVTKSHLRLSKKPIRSTYYVKRANFVACHNQSYVRQYDMVQEVKPGGTFLLNTNWTPEELDANLPGKMKRYIAQNGIRLFTVDAVEVAQRVGLGSHINTVLQAAFFQIAGLMPVDEALDYMKDAARKSYASKGDAVVAKNVAAIDEGAQKCVEVTVPASWADAPLDEPADQADVPAVVENILRPVNAQKGDSLPVSAFAGYEDGVIDMGLTAYEKRGIAVKTPVWNAEACIQCNRCAFVCPHAAIRPYLLDQDEAQNAPEGFTTVALKGGKKLPEGTRYAIQVSQFDCTSCGSCADVCPAGALDMQLAKLTDQARKLWDFGLTISDKDGAFDPYTVKGSQFKQPLLEFSAACAGCGETPYAKLLTQLFGDRVYWANATGCSQAWGLAVPRHPLHGEQARLRPRLDQQSVREQRRAFAGPVPGFRAAARGGEGARGEAFPRPDAWAGEAEGRCGRHARRRRHERHEGRLRGLPCRVRRLRRVAQGRRCPGGMRAGFHGQADQQRTGSVRRGAQVQGPVGEEDVLDVRRRRLGLRHRLRRPGPRGGKRRQRERVGGGHRGVLQHRRPKLQGNAGRCRGAVRGQRQEDRQEGPGRHPHELRQRLRGAGGHGCQLQPAGQGAERSRGVRGPVRDHRLRALHFTRPEVRHARRPRRDEASGGKRLLVAVSLQPAQGEPHDA